MGWNGLAAGAFVWVVPFFISCCVIVPDPETGKMVRLLDEDSFRALMLISGSIASSFATVKSAPRSRREGWYLAVVVLLVNWLLDVAVLVPLMIPETTGNDKISLESWTATVPVWFKRIGVSYAGFVSIFVAAGYNAANAVEATNKAR